MKKHFLAIAFGLFLGTTIVYVMDKYFLLRVELTGKIIERHAVADKYGDMQYYVLVDYGNTIRQENGLKYYVKPVGSTVHKTVTIFK